MTAKRRMKKMQRQRRNAAKPQSSFVPPPIAGEAFTPIPPWVKSTADAEEYRLALQEDYRKKIRKSPMWTRWVKDYGLEKAELMLLECNVQCNVVTPAHDAY